MTDRLNYPGDCTEFDLDHIYGPDIYGAHYQAQTAIYDDATDTTQITLKPIPPTQHHKHIEKQISTRIRLIQLFGASKFE